MEGDITKSILEYEQAVAGYKNIHNSMPATSTKKRDDDDEHLYNLSHELSVNISETNESILEMKKVTTIPVLKNIDKLTNKTKKEIEDVRQSLPFS